MNQTDSSEICTKFKVRKKQRSIYELAKVGYFRYSAYNQQTGESWHNYAVCLMLVSHDLTGARDAFKTALNLSPQDKKIISNFNTLIQDKDFMGMESWDAYSEMMVEQQKQNKT